MKKYAPRKVFILENGEYIEITNVEHESRLDNDPAYANRFFIPVQGFLLDVDQEHYEDFYRTKDRLSSTPLHSAESKKKSLGVTVRRK